LGPPVDPVATSEINPPAADVVIGGGGIVRLSTALFLARQGVSVVVCEKGHFAGEQSSRKWAECVGWAATPANCRSSSATKFAYRKRLDGGYTIANGSYARLDIVPDSFRLFRDFIPVMALEWRDLRLGFGGWGPSSTQARGIESGFERIAVGRHDRRDRLFRSWLQQRSGCRPPDSRSGHRVSPDRRSHAVPLRALHRRHQAALDHKCFEQRCRAFLSDRPGGAGPG
jgi:hypothetical protein